MTTDLTGLREWLAQVKNGDRLLVVTDFDGTLAPLVDFASGRVAIVPGGRTALMRLVAAGRGRDDLMTVVLSGRAVRDLRGRVRVAGLWYIGNHGLEWSEPGRRFPTATTGDRSARRLAERVALALGNPDWLVIEDKGRVAAIHWGGSPRSDLDGDAVMGAVQTELLRQEPEALAVLGHRRAVEIRPPDAPQKGQTIIDLVDRFRPSAVIALGDDETDAQAHAAMRDLVERGALRMAFSVGVSSGDQTPSRLVAGADVMLPEPRGVVAVLSLIAERIERIGTRGSP